jgi:hypothetical protein
LPHGKMTPCIGRVSASLPQIKMTPWVLSF